MPKQKKTTRAGHPPRRAVKSPPMSDWTSDLDIRVLSPNTAMVAMVIARVVRDAMEDFHVRYLSDDQMRELNPIIRNAIATALHAIEHSTRGDPCAKTYLEYSAPPSYWEPPTLLDDFLGLVDLVTGNMTQRNAKEEELYS